MVKKKGNIGKKKKENKINVKNVQIYKDHKNAEALKLLWRPSHVSYVLAFSTLGVSGEFTGTFLDKVLAGMKLADGQGAACKLGDIGAGRGNVVFHAYLKHGVRGVGWELDSNQFTLSQVLSHDLQSKLRGTLTGT